MNIEDTLKEARTKLEVADIPSGRLDAELLLAFVLGKAREWLIAHNDDELSAKEVKTFDQLIGRREGHEPVCYITNKLEFYGIDFYVDNRVLAPRVETELVAEQAILNTSNTSRLIDIGTGSGAIAIAIAKHRPDLDISATEVSADALDVAKLNAKNILGPKHNIKFIKADIWTGVIGRFDTVVTNLPYVSEAYKPRMKPEVAKEPAVALFGGKGDGLDLYRRFYEGLAKHIIPGSLIYHESDPWQHNELTKLAKVARLKPILEDYLILGFKN